MQTYMVVAGVLALLVGAVHSVLGEILIFRRVRSRGIVPTIAAPPLTESNIRIIWASWHVLTVLGWAFGAILLRLASPPSEGSIRLFVENAIIMSFVAGSVLVLIGTKGRHPGWVGLLLVAVLTWLG